ncbi:MAG: hypothetical protein U1F15_15330 [Burkholderiales bacterium]
MITIRPLLALAFASAIGAAAAQAPAPGFDALKGSWVRPDGGYMIAIRDVAPSGQIDALYFNPTRLPFAKAQATRDGAKVRLFFELQAGHYNGSTYDLTYDAAKNQLVGTYYQAVAKQKFSVFFERR